MWWNLVGLHGKKKYFLDSSRIKDPSIEKDIQIQCSDIWYSSVFKHAYHKVPKVYQDYSCL